MSHGYSEIVKIKPKSSSWVGFICRFCGEKFWVINWRIRRAKIRRSEPKYCSVDCRDKYKQHRWNKAEIKKFISGCRVVDEFTGCWFFIGSRDGRLCRNRPTITMEGETYQIAKVVLWAFKNDGRSLIRGREHNACHTCDTPACINPKHLFYGNPKSNAQDKVAKRRDVNSQKTHCPQGHPYNAANTGFTHKGRGRRCLTCHRERERARGRVN